MNLDDSKRRESIVRLLKKLYPLWKDGKVTVILYSALNTVSFADFSSIENCIDYFNKVLVNMVYIKTQYGECEVYIDNYEKYRFNNDKGTLIIKCKNREYILKF